MTIRIRNVDATGDYVFGRGSGNFLVDNAAAVGLLLLNTLNLKEGEWFLDTTAGIPYFQSIMGYGTQQNYDTIIKTAILNTLGVQSIASYSSSLQGRALIVQVTVNTIFGPVTVTSSNLLMPR